MGTNRGVYFFVLQTILTGLWLLYLARRLPVEPGRAETDRGAHIPLGNLAWAVLLGIVWLVTVAAWACGWRRRTYLALEVG